MDWPSTEAYVEAFVAHIGGDLWWTWREGGFEQEMLRNGTPTGAVNYERDGVVHHLPGAANAPAGVRMKFPQVAADLSVRWCSAALKVDVADRVLRNDISFANSRTLFITGERGEESPNRARYSFFEPHRADRRAGKSRRHIDHLRPVLHWKETEVWAIMKRHGIVPHPAYSAGFGRLSCRNCIFASDAQWATLAKHDPDGFEQIATYERVFDRTIHRKDDVVTRARRAKPFIAATEERMMQALAPSFDGPIAVDPDAWDLPAGAFVGHSGPS
jgi:3'-phosphoadenosine 5'-phosphosulfate sulfotransferase (PAPS reductase)/FAD synthetase